MGDRVAIDPETRKTPPQEPVYHFHFEPEPRNPPETPNVDEEPVQITGDDSVIDVGITDNELTFKVTKPQLE